MCVCGKVVFKKIDKSKLWKHFHPHQTKRTEGLDNFDFIKAILTSSARTLYSDKATFFLSQGDIETFGVDPSAPLPEEDCELGVHVMEPTWPLDAGHIATFEEKMSGICGTDTWDISPYIKALDVLRQLKERGN